MSPSARRIWTKAHTWVALSLGWLLALNALMGALLTVAKPLDQWLNRSLFEQPATAAALPPASLQKLHSQLRDEFGSTSNFTFRPPREPGESLRVFVSGAWDGVVFLDAAGRELGRRGEAEGFFNLLFELHSTLLLGEAGRATLACLALCYLVLLVSGLVLWWPLRWPPSFKVRLERGWATALFDLHRTAGALLGLALAVCIVTGAYMAWPPLRQAMTHLAGQPQTTPPAVPMVHGRAESRMPLDSLVTTAQQQFPGAMVGYIQVPGNVSKPVRVRFKLADDPHPNGLSSVWLHPLTGDVLQSTRWNQLDIGSRIITVIYPLHTGALGGWPLTVAIGLLGLTLTGLAISGFWLWGRRQWLSRQRRLSQPIESKPFASNR